jgi:hypothetical protein
MVEVYAANTNRFIVIPVRRLIYDEHTNIIICMLLYTRWIAAQLQTQAVQCWCLVVQVEYPE